MRTFILTYDRQGEVDDKDKEIVNSVLIREISQLLIASGADGITHPVASTLVFMCENKYIYDYWNPIIMDYNKSSKIFFVFGEVYNSTKRHINLLQSDKINHEEFQVEIAKMLAQRQEKPKL